MTLSEFLQENKFNILATLMKHQAGCPDYTHENNIEVGVSYERCICDHYQGDLLHQNQHFGGEYTKMDILYESTKETLELKCAFCNLYSMNNESKVYNCNYKKKNGNSGDNIIDSLPDGMLIYQKYNIDMGIPSLLGYIPKANLIELATNKIASNRTNVYLKISLDDMEWYIRQTNVPVIKPDLKKFISDKELWFKKKLMEERDRLYEICKTGDVAVCNSDEIQYNDARKGDKLSKAAIKQKAFNLREQGLSPFNISKEINIKPDTIKNWLSKKG